MAGFWVPPSPAGPVIYNSDRWPLALMAGVIIAIVPVTNGQSRDLHRIIVSDAGRPGEGMLASAGRPANRREGRSGSRVCHSVSVDRFGGSLL